jgi:hypothetical protein
MGEWIEVDLLGKVVRRVEMPEKTIGAFSDDGSLYARGYQGDYSVLNPAGTSWQPFSGATGGNLLGADGDSLVFLIRGTNLLVWSPRVGDAKGIGGAAFMLVLAAGALALRVLAS